MCVERLELESEINRARSLVVGLEGDLVEARAALRKLEIDRAMLVSAGISSKRPCQRIRERDGEVFEC